MADSAAAKVWQDPHSTASALVVLLIDRYGSEATDWAPGTWRMEIFDDCKVMVDEHVVDRLSAAVTVLTQPDRVAGDFNCFETIARVMHAARDGERHDTRDLADALDCAWGVAEIAVLTGRGVKYGTEVQEYVAKALEDYGLGGVAGGDIDVPFKAAGLKLPQANNTPMYDYSDDPVAFSADYAGRRANFDGVSGTFRDAVTTVTRQVASLPLLNGNSQALVQKIESQKTLKG